jgi:hypothetical protein
MHKVESVYFVLAEDCIDTLLCQFSSNGCVELGWNPANRFERFPSVMKPACLG